MSLDTISFITFENTLRTNAVFMIKAFMESASISAWFAMIINVSR